MAAFLYPQLTAILKGTPTWEDWGCVVKTLQSVKNQDELLTDRILIALCMAAESRKQLAVVPPEIETLRSAVQGRPTEAIKLH